VNDEIWERFANFETQALSSQATDLDILWTSETRPSDVYACLPILQRSLDTTIRGWPIPPFAVMAETVVADSSRDQISLRWSGFAVEAPVKLSQRLDVQWIESESLWSSPFAWRWTWQFRDHKLQKIMITVSSPNEPAVTIAEWATPTAPVQVQTGLNPDGSEDVWVLQAGTPGRWISSSLVEVYQAMLDAQYAWWNSDQQQRSLQRLSRIAAHGWFENGSTILVFSLMATTLGLILDMHGWSHTSWVVKLGFFLGPGLGGTASYIALRHRLAQRVAVFRGRFTRSVTRGRDRGNGHLFS